MPTKHIASNDAKKSRCWLLFASPVAAFSPVCVLHQRLGHAIIAYPIAPPLSDKTQETKKYVQNEKDGPRGSK